MIAYPNAKVNLGLYIVGKREDGYHNIETVFFPVKRFCDILEIHPSATSATATLHVTGISIGSRPEHNLCFKAWLLLNKAYGIPPVDIYLHKQIPFGAGLGGGSSDAAHSLILLNSLFNLELSKENLKQYAAELGSDCPFFIENSTMYAEGRGEVLSPVALPLAGYFLVIAIPPVNVSTAEAYRKVVPKQPNINLQELHSLPLASWHMYLKNDFEESVFTRYPIIKQVKEQLYQKGALYASMSGSGSSVVGIFKEKPVLNGIFHDCFVFCEEIN